MGTKWQLRLAGIVAAIALLGTSCSGPGEEKDADADELLPRDAEAQTMLLTLSDFPTGWTEDKSEDNTPTEFAKCEQEAPSGRVGHAATGNFSENGTSSIEHSVVVFETADDASKSWDRFGEFAGCMAKVINDGKLDDDEMEAGGAKVQEMSFPALGDATRANRITFTAKSKEDSGPFSQVDAFIDVIWVQQGEVAFTLVATDVLTPFSISMVEEMAHKALTKIPSE